MERSVNLLKKLMVTAALVLFSQTAFSEIDSSGAGTVAETIDVDEYLYVRLAENDNWLAAAPTDISVGDKVNYSGGALMKDFYSRTLDQSFDEILFVMTLYVTEKAPTDPNALVEQAHEAAGALAAEPPKPGEIAPAPGGMTIAELYAGYSRFQGENISVRGRVMKFSEDILGTNWVTLQDGSGIAPDNKLVAKTDATLTVGDEVTVKGTVATDVNLGTGYDYKVLLEDSTVLQ